jgi:hypothetical protein
MQVELLKYVAPVRFHRMKAQVENRRRLFVVL